MLSVLLALLLVVVVVVVGVLLVVVVLLVLVAVVVDVVVLLVVVVVAVVIIINGMFGVFPTVAGGGMMPMVVDVGWNSCSTPERPSRDGRGRSSATCSSSRLRQTA